MTRVHATALALVNWKGVFYERYLLDRNVTALEGANGAGKTTVMIAAYVVMLPDLGRLRFSNVGETTATGGDKGLYGRLGEPGKPSYAALELALGDGSSLIAGVRLVRKAEPQLELTPFLVTGLALEGHLQELLLTSRDGHDEVPELDELRAAVHRLGGTLIVCASTKEYFAELFDRGVTPLRLATDEERGKLHDMLRTSMTGGISRALTSELRSFLLKEETGLSDTLTRMRQNLDACKRTRSEVGEARVLEREIHGVHAAGRAMFDAAAQAQAAALADLEARRVAAEARLRAADAAVAAIVRETEAAATTRTQTLDALAVTASTLTTLTTERNVRARAAALATQLAAATRDATDARTTADALRAACERATGTRDDRRSSRDTARAAHERAARGLGDLQAGLAELHARVHAQRAARATLDEARRLLREASEAPATVRACDAGAPRTNAVDGARTTEGGAPRTDAVHTARTDAMDAARTIAVDGARATEGAPPTDAVNAPRTDAVGAPRIQAAVTFDLAAALGSLDETTPSAATLDEVRRRVIAAREVVDAVRVRLDREASVLGAETGEVAKLARAIGGEPLAGMVAAQDADDASALEAALGPLAHALVVDDEQLAASKLAAVADAPPSVWLVRRAELPRLLADARAAVTNAARSSSASPAFAAAHTTSAMPSVVTVFEKTGVVRVSRPVARPLVGRDELVRKLAAERAALDAERDRLFAAERAVEAALAQRDALEGPELGDAPVAPSDVARALAVQHEQALASLTAAEAALADADAEWTHASLAYQAAHGAAIAKEAARDRLTEELLELTGPPRSDAGSNNVRTGPRSTGHAAVDGVDAPRDLAALDAELARLEEERDRLDALERELARTLTVAQERRGEAERQARIASSALGEIAREESPRRAEWIELAERAHELKVELPSGRRAHADDAPSTDGERDLDHEHDTDDERDLDDERDPDDEHDANTRRNAGAKRAAVATGDATTELRSEAELRAEARAQRELVLARLEAARGGAETADLVRKRFAEHGDGVVGYLEAWREARAWVMRRLPTHVATAVDPDDALGRLRHDLGELARRVEQHEVDLRGASEDVAHGIDVQVRKTMSRVRALNHELAAISFGSVASVRITVKRVERMDTILRALRGGDVQELLFRTDLPFEDALAEVFHRYGGGGRGGAHKLLDYREYVELAVEIRRKAAAVADAPDAPETWELASPTRLSTGEAIGIGAAIMMVVLTEWERDGNVLAHERTAGTLRFLFLDEANRLSQDNLGVLFDLCRTLDLQLLVAAPEVARAFGNTTYRLVRRVDERGAEEVWVTGRRASTPSA